MNSASPPTGGIPITGIVLARDEEVNLSRCLESLEGWVREVFVVDSGSTDDTRVIAERSGARVVEHPFRSHSTQWRWALEHLPMSTEWVLALDADQWVTPKLREELSDLFLRRPERLARFDGFYVPRRQIFRGRAIRHGGYGGKRLLKLFRRDRVTLDPHDLVDHHFFVRGPTETLGSPIEEENHKEDDLSFWLEKHLRYARQLAIEEVRRRNGGAPWQEAPLLFGSPDQRVIWLKRAWHRLPLYVRPVLYFFYRYFLRLGFLDGKQGFVFHFFHAFWYRLLVDLHVDEQLDSHGGHGP